MLANIRHLLELIAEKIGFDRMNAIYRYKSWSQRKATQITFLHVYFTKTHTCDQWTWARNQYVPEKKCIACIYSDSLQRFLNPKSNNKTHAVGRKSENNQTEFHV